MIRRSLSDLFRLFYPEICICCDTHLLVQEEIICLLCRADLPLIDNANYKSNALTRVFEGKVPIEKGASFLLYRHIGKTKQLIHELKYRNNPNIGTFIGGWFGKVLLRSGAFSDIDCIVPVPLHKRKRKQRGYNQLTQFGKTLGEVLKKEYLENYLIRITTGNTQTFKKRIERFDNLRTKFTVTNVEVFKNKHVLLIDDVVTTGATLEACCKEIMKSENVKISIVTMAITE